MTAAPEKWSISPLSALRQRHLPVSGQDLRFLPFSSARLGEVLSLCCLFWGGFFLKRVEPDYLWEIVDSQLLLLKRKNTALSSPWSGSKGVLSHYLNTELQYD